MYTIMSISFSPLSGQISFTNIQTQFNGGTNPISLSEYLIGASGRYVNGTNIPSMNINYTTATTSATQISVLNFYNKRNLQYDLYEYIVPGNKLGDMSETGGTTIINSAGFGSNPTNASIGTVGFSFFWFGYDAGINNNIQWNTNNAITFGGGNLGNNLDWSLATTAKSFLIGTDPPLRRWTQMSKGFTSYILYGHNIKRFIVKAADSSSASTSRYELDINLIRGPFYQYIELKIVKWLTSAPNIVGMWNISDGVKFYNPFTLNSPSPPVGTGASLVLRGSLQGTDWVVFPNYYMNIPYATITSATDAIKSMGANLILRLDGYNIDGSNNSTLTATSKISSWVNSGNGVSLTTLQEYSLNRPTYNTKGGVIFSPTKFLYSSIDLNHYPIMNFFFVWKNTEQATTSLRYIWAQSVNYRRFMYQSISNTSLIVPGISNIVVGGTVSNGLLYHFPLNTTVVINCEYNLVGTNLNTKLYINNNLKLTTIATTLGIPGPLQATATILGSANSYGDYGIDGIVYEVIVINRVLSETERKNIYDLLETRWGPTLDNDYITSSMSSNLVHRTCGDNIDSRNNITLPIGSTIKYWYNSGNNWLETETTQSSTKQLDTTIAPTCVGNGVLFSDNTRIESFVKLTNYPKMNIFVVWKKTQTSTISRYLWSQHSGTASTGHNRSLFISGDTSVNVGSGNNTLLTITYTFPLYATTVVNCEYNSLGSNGNFYINNQLLGIFNNTAFTSTVPSTTSYGGSYSRGSINGIIYEIIIINRLLSDTERDNIYNSLNVKWGPFYTDAITSIGNKLVLRLDGYNIDGIKNSRLTSGSKISSWFNSGNTYSLTATQSTSALQPTYNNNGVEFLNNSTTVLVSNINLTSYSKINIFVVWKKTANTLAGTNNYLWSCYTRGAYFNNKYLLVGEGSEYIIPYNFSIGNTYIVNYEYNTTSSNSSKVYIQNILLYKFSSTILSTAANNTYFGNVSSSAPSTSTIKGIFYEIIVINDTLTDTERTKIYNFLDNNWCKELPNAIMSMSTNLIFRLDGKNIDGTNNSTLTSGTSKISSWFNSGITPITFTQPTPKINDTSYPLYNMDGAYFSNNIELESDITLGNYRSINIFMVFKMTATSSNIIYMWVDSTMNMTRAFIINPNSTITIMYGSIISQVINFTFDINSIYIVNCEYDTFGSERQGYFWINNILKATFTCGTGTFFSTWFGSYSSAGNQLTGAIYEIIIINKVLSVTERNNIYDFLSVKWGSLFKISSMMNINLVFWLDGKNIDGTNNSTLTSGTSTISSWSNLGYVTGLTATQTVVAKRPTYTNNSVVFNSVNGLDCSMNLFNYQIMNVIIVLSLTEMPITVTNYNNFANAWALWVNQDAGRLILISNGKIHIGKGYGTGNFSNDIVSIDKTSLLNTIEIYHIEYNIVSKPGKFYINNILQISFTTLNAINPSYTGTQQPSIGYRSDYYYLKGKIYEVLIIDRLLSDTERTNIYNLLKTKWNVP